MDVVPEIEMSRYGLEESRELAGLDGIVSFSDSQVQTVADLKKKLEETYCENISVEFMQIEDEYEREWFMENYEKLMEEKEFITVEEKRAIITEMIKFQEFDRFMNVKLPAIKRYGGEGAESMVAFFQNILKNAALDDVNSIVLGMPHRGKLSALVTLFRHRPARIFRKYKGLPEFGGETNAMMDIPSHFSKFSVVLCLSNAKYEEICLFYPSDLAYKAFDHFILSESSIICIDNFYKQTFYHKNILNRLNLTLTNYKLFVQSFRCIRGV